MIVRRVLATVALGAALVACGSDDDGGTTTDVVTTDAPPPPTAPVTTDEPPATDPVATDAPPATDPVATEPVATEPPSTVPPSQSFAEVAGLATIELQPAEAGAQPLLKWAPVDGAASYVLVTLTSDGSPYWSWSGEATEVRFGGAPEGGGQTAVVFEPLTWRVVALDADGMPLAIAEPGELTP